MAIQKRIKESDSYFKFVGLKPYTRHYFYYEVLNRSDRCKQFGKKLGDPLITDENGMLEFSFYNTTGIKTDSTGSDVYRSFALSTGIKEAVVTNINQTQLPADYTLSSVSSAKVTIKV